MKAVRLLIDDEAFDRLQMLSHYTRAPIEDLLTRALDKGMLHWGWKDHADAPGCLALWLRLTRGYKRQSANSAASLVRRALREGEDLDVWREDPTAQEDRWRRRTAVTLWREWCVIVGHDELALEFTSEALAALLDKFHNKEVKREHRPGLLDGVR